MALAKTDPPSSPLLMAALDYAARGIPVFPLRPRDKLPLTEHGFLDASADPDVIRQWWRRWPQANVGIPTGPASGWLVVDVDTRHGATYDTLAALGKLPPTMMAQTGSGGLHLVFRYPRDAVGDAELRNSAGKLAPGVDVRGAGGYIVAAPSRHPSGGQYEWTNDLEPAPLPTWLRALMTAEPAPIRNFPRARHEVTQGNQDDRDAYWLDWALAQSGPGTGDATGYKLAQQLYLDAGVRDMDGTLSEYARRATLDAGDPFDERDVDRWLKSAQGSRMVSRGERAKRTKSGSGKKQSAKRPEVANHAAPRLEERPPLYAVPPLEPPDDGGDEPPGEPPERKPDDELHCTDMGNARRFVRQHAAAVRYVGLWGHWMTWDTRRWQHDWTGEAARLAKRTVRSIYAEAAEEGLDDYRRKDLAKWAMRSEGRDRLTALLAVAQSEPEIARTPEHFDMQPWHLTVLNGTLDLRTGRLGTHDPTHGISRLAPVEYDPDAPCPLWLAFLDRIMAGNGRLIAFLQRAVGYSLTDSTREQVLFLLHGNGANGKSRFLEAMEGVLGDYGMSTPTSTLMAKRDNNIPNDVARLKGARFVKAIETEEGHALAESLVKQMTGGDMITARFMRGEWFDFKPTFKLWLAANHLPTIRGTDDGIWRRIRYIPFDVQIPDGEKDEELGDKLRAEYPGILAWAVRGCLDWQREGLGQPEEVRVATQSYRDTMNHFGRFVEESCVLEKSAGVTAKLLRQAYEQWCEENGERAKSQVWVSKELQAMKVSRERGNDGATLYAGIRLRSQGA